MAFTGSCHCGAIAYTANEDLPTKAMECNCSICRRKGYLHHFMTPDRFELRGSREALRVYTFASHNIRHQFCSTCGCAPFAEGKTPDGAAMVALNLRCTDGLDVHTLQIIPYDGASK